MGTIVTQNVGGWHRDTRTFLNITFELDTVKQFIDNKNRAKDYRLGINTADGNLFWIGGTYAREELYIIDDFELTGSFRYPHIYGWHIRELEREQRGAYQNVLTLGRHWAGNRLLEIVDMLDSYGMRLDGEEMLIIKQSRDVIAATEECLMFIETLRVCAHVIRLLLDSLYPTLLSIETPAFGSRKSQIQGKLLTTISALEHLAKK